MTDLTITRITYQVQKHLWQPFKLQWCAEALKLIKYANSTFCIRAITILFTKFSMI